MEATFITIHPRGAVLRAICRCWGVHLKRGPPLRSKAALWELWSVWRSATDPRRRLTYDRVIGLFHAMDLYPSKSQSKAVIP
ncbi:hypothetical protein FJT64_001312 [Amphibalanus amphitrite]|uniref:Uncharacterized protein n=1 Tax=Amphibalanus amphitrite TaxID=1232801 RepID=A0A6A4V6G0_AMPAM|nr:hypothetical protein FJT64_001312 [Amphibalanus amphitrite]